MKTKNIFKTLAFAMLMPAMMLTTACSNEDDVVNNAANSQSVAKKGYTLPVTVNVTREGDEGTTRATYNESTKKLSFSTGDKLFVSGNHADAGKFAGTLDYDAVSGKFSGTVTTEKEYTGTIDDLMASAAAFLLPDGYESYGFFSVGSGSYPMITFDFTKAFALTKAAAVEQFSFEHAFEYSSGFALAPVNAIVSFTISGLTANKEVAVSIDTYGTGVISRNVTTSAEGVATFAIGVSAGQNLGNFTLTVDGNNIAMPTATTAAGKIYNISRPVHGVFWNSSDISSIDLNYEEGSIEIRGITFACDYSSGFSGSTLSSISGNISFTSSLGNIKKIEINHSGSGYWYGAEGFDGWPSDYDAGVGTFTWEGTPTDKVELPETGGWSEISGITSIVFTLE